MRLSFFSIVLLLGFWLSKAHGQNAAGGVDIVHYHHQLSLSESHDSIKGVSTIYFTTTSDKVTLNLIGVDTSGTGMRVASVSDLTGNPLNFSHENDSLHVTLESKKGEGVIRIAYHGRPRDGLIIGENKFGDRTWFGDNWPNRAQNWIPVVDHPQEKAKVDFTVQVPKGYSVVANGVLSGVDSTQAMNIWHYSCRHEIPSKVMVIGVARFSVKTYRDSSITEVSAWVYPQNETNGFYDYGLAPSILSFYDSLFGDYPYDKLANVQSTTRYGGMENASCIFYSESSIDGHRSSEGLIAHEIVHQWFGNTATECDWPHIWLSEGFATYFTEVYFEKTYGEERFNERWETVRSRVLKFYTAKPNGKIVDTYSNLNWHLSPLTYQRAAMVLHMLRLYMGDESFFQGVQSYYTEYRYKNACSEDFIEVISKHSELDIAAFLKPWLQQAKIPELKIESKLRGKNVKLFYERLDDVSHQLVIPYYVTYNTGKREKRVVIIKNSDGKLNLEFEKPIAALNIDPYGESLVYIRK